MSASQPLGPKHHHWKVRRPDLRDLLIAHRWVLKGAYAEKSIDGRFVMLRTVADRDGHSVVRVQWKDAF
jgi:hypothetical protein